MNTASLPSKKRRREEADTVSPASSGKRLFVYFDMDQTIISTACSPTIVSTSVSREFAVAWQVPWRYSKSITATVSSADIYFRPSLLPVLKALQTAGIPWGIFTANRLENARSVMHMLHKLLERHQDSTDLVDKLCDVSWATLMGAHIHKSCWQQQSGLRPVLTTGEQQSFQKSLVPFTTNETVPILVDDNIGAFDRDDFLVRRQGLLVAPFSHFSWHRRPSNLQDSFQPCDDGRDSPLVACCLQLQRVLDSNSGDCETGQWKEVVDQFHLETNQWSRIEAHYDLREKK